jgi:hypothetical protein
MQVFELWRVQRYGQLTHQLTETSRNGSGGDVELLSNVSWAAVLAE